MEAIQVNEMYKVDSGDGRVFYIFRLLFSRLKWKALSHAVNVSGQIKGFLSFFFFSNWRIEWILRSPTSGWLVPSERDDAYAFTWEPSVVSSSKGSDRRRWNRQVKRDQLLPNALFIYSSSSSSSSSWVMMTTFYTDWTCDDVARMISYIIRRPSHCWSEWPLWDSSVMLSRWTATIDWHIDDE